MKLTHCSRGSQWLVARWCLVIMVSLAVTTWAMAQESPQRITKANYPQAFKYSREFLQQFTYDSSVNPQWIGKSDVFWYSYRTSKGTRYWRVDARQAKKEPLFDQTKLASQLAESLQKPVESHALPMTRVSLNEEGTLLKFVSNDWQFEFDLKSEKLNKIGKAPPAPASRFGREELQRMTEQERQRFLEERRRNFQDQQQQQQDQQQQQQQDQQQQQQQDQQQQQQDQQRQDNQTTQSLTGGPRRGMDYRVFSPDRKWFVFALKYNLWLAEADKEKDAKPITQDGVEDYSFGGSAEDRKARPNVTWASDSKSFHVTRSDARQMKELFLVNSLADPRPSLEKYKYAMPGESGIRRTELWVYHLPKSEFTKIPIKWKDESYTNIHFGKSGEELRFIRRDRLRRNLEICSWNIATKDCQCVLSEGFENAYQELQPIRYIEETGEMIWWSERSGWGHFYLYDREGKIKNPVTSGEFRASRIVAIDVPNRTMYFQANGREPGENVYYQHLYRVRLDGTGLTLLDPGDYHHNSSLSPSRQFLVDNATRVDQVPFSVLRDADGKLVLELEKMDVSRLNEVGWQPPETFIVKAADGVTDLYGNLWKPFDFDPKKKYPIILNVYPGPQTEGVTHTFGVYSGNMQLAQLGFIVIQVGHRGGSPQRSKAYASFGYFNLRDYGLADKKAAVEQLASRFNFIDVDRVGIFGHSGGGFMSAAALLQKPYNEFFKAAVASAGNHDNNIYNDSWSERYHGLKEVPVKKEQVAQTQSATTTTNTDNASGTNRTQQNTNRNRRGGGPDEDEKKTEGDKKKEEEQKKLEKSDQKKDESKDEGKKEEQKKEQSQVDKKETVQEKDKEKAKADKKVDEKHGTGQTEVKKEEEKKTVQPPPPPETQFEIRVPTNSELAANLKGALLLVHGEIDNNVHPANTMRLVDALIKANKRFDMLILPGKRHGFGDYQPYFTQRMWDFFVDHLMGDRPGGADIFDKQFKK